jgi:hypothetical protein
MASMIHPLSKCLTCVGIFLFDLKVSKIKPANIRGIPMKTPLKRICTLVACIFAFMPISKAAIDIQFDYSKDEAHNNFFGDANAKNSLEAAAAFFEGLLQDTFDAIIPGTVYNPGTIGEFSDTWTVNFNSPGDGSAQAIVDKTIAADTIIIYAGGRNIDGVSNTLGQGGAWGFSVGGIDDFVDTVLNRGETGITDGTGTRLATETDFAPGGGSIVFDTSENWHFDDDVTSTTAPTGGKIDFLSVALHELGHVLGIGTANGGLSNDGSWSGKITAGEFTGAFSKAANGNANVTLNGA